MKFGIIGYGRMGKVYEKVLESMGFEIGFICDKISSKSNQKFYSDYIQALDIETVDGLVIATYGPSHYEIVSTAIEKKIKFIVCEKPFTTSAKSADILASKLKNSETRLTVNYSRRFSKTYAALHDILYLENILGEPRCVSIFCGAGGISTVGTHFFDLCCYLLDEAPKSVYAVPVDKNLPNPRGSQFRDPGGYLLLNFQNEKRAFIDLGDDLGLQPMIEVVCEFGRVFIDELNKNIEIRGRSRDDQKKPKHLYGTQNTILRKDVFTFESLDTLVKSLIKNLISTTPLLVTPEMASEKVRIYSAIRKSFDIQQPVMLSLNDSYYEKEFPVT